MQLDEYEQRALDAIEKDLSQDRRFVRQMQRGTDRYELRRILIWTSTIFVVILITASIIGG